MALPLHYENFNQIDFCNVPLYLPTYFTYLCKMLGSSNYIHSLLHMYHMFCRVKSGTMTTKILYILKIVPNYSKQLQFTKYNNNYNNKIIIIIIIITTTINNNNSNEQSLSSFFMSHGFPFSLSLFPASQLSFCSLWLCEANAFSIFLTNYTFELQLVIVLITFISLTALYRI